MVYRATCHHCGALLALVEDVPPPASIVRPWVASPEDLATRVRTIEPVDRLLRGLPRGKPVIIMGRKGSGKSTLGLQLAAAAATSLYIPSEWSAADAEQRRTELGLEPREGQLLADTTDTDEAADAIREHAPDLAVLDAWQAFRSKHADPGRYAQMLYTYVEVLAACIDANAACVMISRVTKKGEFLGREELLHECRGAVLKLKVFPKSRRLLHIEKTRISSDGSVRLVFDEHGLRAPRIKSAGGASVTSIATKARAPQSPQPRR